MLCFAWQWFPAGWDSHRPLDYQVQMINLFEVHMFQFLLLIQTLSYLACYDWWVSDLPQRRNRQY